MHALIIVTHPNPKSLTHGIAARVAEGVTQAEGSHSFEIVDLSAEGFSPAFTTADLAVHHKEAPPPPDVRAEQARIERSDALVLVYPVYWWSMPALLKGWIDRVFSNGWAFDFTAAGGLVKKLRHLPIHQIAVAGADADTYSRHGYRHAMKTQIDHGIFDYCGASVVTSELVFDSETEDPAAHLAAAKKIGESLFDAAQAAPPDHSASTSAARER